MSAVALVMKATRRCNLRCTYCQDWRAGAGEEMRFDVLAHAVAAALRDPVHDAVEFVWHGGEPTLRARRFYEKALRLQAIFRRRGQRVSNALQTNATLLDGAWVRFLAEHRIDVSLSLDGPPALHDRTRPMASGAPSAARVLAAIELLRTHGVPFGVLMVVDEEALALGPERVFDAFVALGIRSYGVLPATPPAAGGGHRVAPRRMNAFLAGLHDRWVAHGDPGIRIRELDALRARIAGDRGASCTVSGGCLGRFYAVEPDGAVYHCDLCSADRRYHLGNVLRDGFGRLRRSPALRALRAEHRRDLAGLRSCPELPVCRGGCPHQRHLARAAGDGEDGCCGLSELIAHLRRAPARAPGPERRA